jgi:hypothetical protein
MPEVARGGEPLVGIAIIVRRAVEIHEAEQRVELAGPCKGRVAARRLAASLLAGFGFAAFAAIGFAGLAFAVFAGDGFFAGFVFFFAAFFALAMSCSVSRADRVVCAGGPWAPGVRAEPSSEPILRS